MSDKLVEIFRNDLPALKAIFKSNGAKNYIGCVTIQNYIRSFKQNPKVDDVRIYCLNGDFSDGTFVVTVNREIGVIFCDFSIGFNLISGSKSCIRWHR